VNVLDLVRLILRQLHSDQEPDVRNEAMHEIPHQHLSAAKARRELDWSPRFGLEEGLARTIAWYRQELGEAGTDRLLRADPAGSALLPRTHWSLAGRPAASEAMADE